VSPSIVSALQEESEKPRLYLMRAAYGQESKAAAWLADKEGIEEVFVRNGQRIVYMQENARRCS
jgi:hypothetical protein